MGDRWRKAQVGNFRKRCDLAMREVSERHLIIRPDVMTTIFTLKPDVNRGYVVGENVLAMMADDRSVAIVRGHERIGTVDGDGADKLRDVLSAIEGPGVAQLRVLDVGALSGVATAAVLAN
jgi:hypothetical protein